MKIKIHKTKKDKQIILIENFQTKKYFSNSRCVNCSNSIISINFFGDIKTLNKCTKLKGKFNLTEYRTCDLFKYNKDWEKRFNLAKIYSEDILKPY